MLMRIAGLDARTSKRLCNVATGTYNAWFKDDTFNDLHHQLSELSYEHRQEAIQLLRRGNQLEAVLLEGKVIQKMKEEIESGEYALLRTNLAKSVYDRLLTDLDTTPQQQSSMTWEQKIAVLVGHDQPQEIGGVNEEHQLEEASSQQAEYPQSYLPSKSE